MQSGANIMSTVWFNTKARHSITNLEFMDSVKVNTRPFVLPTKLLRIQAVRHRLHRF